MTVVARTLRSLPERGAIETWNLIVELIAPSPDGAARAELQNISGVACSCIAEEALRDDAVVVHGVGPRLKIYALYGDDAIEGDKANESRLSWVPTDGDWRLSLPCREDDLTWVRAKLSRCSTRVSARAIGQPADEARDEQPPGATNDAKDEVDVSAFFRQ